VVFDVIRALVVGVGEGVAVFILPVVAAVLLPSAPPSEPAHGSPPAARFALMSTVHESWVRGYFL
jgi:hypothetical protein